MRSTFEEITPPRSPARRSEMFSKASRGTPKQDV
jgi:hypothetical protein